MHNHNNLLRTILRIIMSQEAKLEVNQAVRVTQLLNLTIYTKLQPNKDIQSQSSMGRSTNLRQEMIKFNNYFYRTKRQQLSKMSMANIDKINSIQ